MVLGNPVWGKDFFDRKNEREKLADASEQFEKGSRNNIAIVGLRKIGKTSLIKQFIYENQKSKNFIYLEVYMPEKNTEDFIRKCFMEITRRVIKKLEIGNKESLTIATAIELIQQKYPRTALALLQGINLTNSKDYPQSFDSIFKLLDVMSNELKLKTIFFLDEFQRISEYSNEIPSAIDKFREHVMNDEGTLYIISGSAVGMLNRLISSSKSPLYGHFERIHLRGFEFEDSLKFIENKKPKELILNQAQQLFLYEATNGNPFYLDILINEFRKFVKDSGNGKMNNQNYKKILIGQIFHPGGRIYSYFDSMVEQSLEKSGSKYYTKILISVSRGYKRPSQIAKDTDIPLSTLPPYLKKLIELELLTKKKRGNKSHVAEYEYADSLFEMWIRYVYGLKEDSFIRDIEDSLKIYSNKLSEVIDIFNSELGRGYEARVRELFEKFDERIIDEEIFPKFDTVKRLVRGGDIEIDIFCEKNDGCWAVEISKKTIDASKITDFKKKLDQITDKKIERKIIIAIKDMTPEARRRCEEYNFEIWSLEKINRLMKEYHLFRILPI